MPEAKITPNEATMIRAIAHNEYSDRSDPTAPSWVFSAITASGLDEQVAGGVITSLQAKGLATVQVYEARGDSDKMVSLTDAGVAALDANPAPTLGILVHVLVPRGMADCTNGGVSSRYKAFVLIGEGIDGYTEPTDDTPALRLVRRTIGRRQADYCVPTTDLRADYPTTYAGPMMGGNFVYTSDSRMPGHRPLPVHDRFDTWPDHERLTR
jgi:hypothetical protein